MKYEKLKKLSEEKFRRATGVKKNTFSLMLEIINKVETKKKEKGGRPNKLSVEDRLLMTFEYLREYRTYFHIAQSYGVAESVCFENTRAIEYILIKSGKFSLPKRKDIVLSEDPIEIVLIDATENATERPKKRIQRIVKTAKSITILARKSSTRSKHR